MFITGAITALITPFDYNDNLDENILKNLVELQISSGIHGICGCGTTGEASTLTQDEYIKVIEIIIDTVKKRVPVIIGTGSNSTKDAIKYAKIAQSMGADAIMVVVPYYNKPTQEGLMQHFKAISEAVSLPIILYNVPSRTGVNLAIETIVKLAEIDNIVGIKDATSDMNRPLILRSKIKKKFSLLCGDDSLTLAFNAQGGNGCISVASNIVPDLCANLQNLWHEGEFKGALELQTTLVPLYNILFCETNPIPVKYAANILGLCAPNVRLPLVQPSTEHKRKIEDILKQILI